MFNLLIAMNTDIRHLDDTKADKINVLTAMSYLAIEQGRTDVVADLFVDFGVKLLNVKEEELEPFRCSAIRKLNRSIKIGTARGK